MEKELFEKLEQLSTEQLLMLRIYMDALIRDGEEPVKASD